MSMWILDRIKKSLRTKLVLASVVIEIIMLGLLLANSVRLINDNIRHHAIDDVEETSPMLNAALAPLLFQRDLASMTDFLGELPLGPERGLSYVVVFDDRNQIYAHKGKVDIKKLPSLDRDFEDAVRDGVFDTKTPLKLSGVKIGEARFGISLGSDLTSKKAVLSQGLLIASGEVLLTIILLSIIGFMLTRHIGTLMKGSREMASGNYSIKLAIPGTDEISQLAKDFNRMAAAVNQRSQSLAESEERYRSLVENQTELVSRFTPDGKLVFMNDAFCSFFEKTKDELIGKKWQPLPVNDDVPLIQDKLRTLSPSNPAVLMENRIPSGKGDIHWIQFVNSGLFDADGNLLQIQSVGRDITERKQAEEEKDNLQTKLQRAQKMEAMGLMAGGVAHDLNNILSGLVSYPELLLMDLTEDSPLWNPIKTMQESGMRAAEVVEDLMTIARGVASGSEALNLNRVVEEYLDSIEYGRLEKARSLVSCRTELDPDLLNMRGSVIHIRKILMNLVPNASEAIDGSGTVTISTTNRYLDEPLMGYEDVREGEYVVLTVSDDGSGISRQDLERIFEPFYTKKVMGRSGTGLGLAVVWNTVQDHKGYINVKSSGEGTVFELYFPVTRDQLSEDREDIPVAEYLGHGEKILVVDDEERQREIASGMLTKLDYVVQAVSSGEGAIEYVKAHPVDLIVLDMVMPKGINGRKTYEEIVKIRPGQKAVIASGYAKSKEVDRAQKSGAGKYIKKPYTLEKIGLAVKEELKK